VTEESGSAVRREPRSGVSRCTARPTRGCGAAVGWRAYRRGGNVKVVQALSVAPILDAPRAATMPTAINGGPSQQPHRGADPADAVCLSERDVAALAARGVLDDHRMMRHLRKGAMVPISGLDRGMQVRRPIAHAKARCGLRRGNVMGGEGGHWTLKDDPVIGHLRPHLPPATANLATMTGYGRAGGVVPPSRCCWLFGVSNFHSSR
jgi:hypothetical protein